MANVLNITQERFRNLLIADQWLTNLGNPVDLTGCTIALTIKNSAGDPDASALYKSEAPTINYPFGLYSFELTPTQVTALNSGSGTVTLVYDVSLKTQTARQYTVYGGTLTLTEPVTRGF
jgi:hypothetical protein